MNVLAVWSSGAWLRESATWLTSCCICASTVAATGLPCERTVRSSKDSSAVCLRRDARRRRSLADASLLRLDKRSEKLMRGAPFVRGVSWADGRPNDPRSDSRISSKASSKLARNGEITTRRVRDRLGSAGRTAQQDCSTRRPWIPGRCADFGPGRESLRPGPNRQLPFAATGGTGDPACDPHHACRATLKCDELVLCNCLYLYLATLGLHPCLASHERTVTSIGDHITRLASIDSSAMSLPESRPVADRNLMPKRV